MSRMRTGKLERGCSSAASYLARCVPRNRGASATRTAGQLMAKSGAAQTLGSSWETKEGHTKSKGEKALLPKTRDWVVIHCRLKF